MDQAKPVGRIDVISDVICPWCYIGKRHLERALAILDKQGLHFTVAWHPFQLNPDMPREGVDRAQYRLAKFGEEQPDPGGVALMLTTKLPTGNRENFRGLGITRVLGSVLVSAGKGKLRPHGNVGFEWWEKGLEVDTDFTGEHRVGARHQAQFAAGLEFEAGPKMTFLADILGRKILGGGQVRIQGVPVPPELSDAGITSLTMAVATAKGIQKLTLAPGFKWNLKGSFVFAGNALIPLFDNGLHDKFTPVVGIDWTF